MSDLLTARAQAARECAAFYVAELRGAGLPAFREQLAADLAERTLELGGPFDALTDAYDKALRIAEGTEAALRDVLAQTERERDALLREKRWRECWEHLHGSSADLDTKSAARRETQRIALRGYGQLLRAVRSAVLVEGRYVTMLDAARAIGCSVPTLSDVERSKAPPFDDATTRKLCAYLGCDPAPLLAAAARCEGVLR